MRKHILDKVARKTLILLALTVAATALSSAAAAQSTDPDHPSPISSGMITGSHSGGLSDTTAYYYYFDVNKGTLTGIFDLIPNNRSDGGGLMSWTLMTAKFQDLKYDNMSAQGTPDRKVKDMPVTIKRRIILKLEISGNVSYKIKLNGSAFIK